MQTLSRDQPQPPRACRNLMSEQSPVPRAEKRLLSSRTPALWSERRPLPPSPSRPAAHRPLWNGPRSKRACSSSDCHRRFVLSLASGYSHCFPVISRMISSSTVFLVSRWGRGEGIIILWGAPRKEKEATSLWGRRKTGGVTMPAWCFHCGW